MRGCKTELKMMRAAPSFSMRGMEELERGNVLSFSMRRMESVRELERVEQELKECNWNKREGVFVDVTFLNERRGPCAMYVAEITNLECKALVAAGVFVGQGVATVENVVVLPRYGLGQKANVLLVRTLLEHVCKTLFAPENGLAIKHVLLAPQSARGWKNMSTVVEPLATKTLEMVLDGNTEVARLKEADYDTTIAMYRTRRAKPTWDACAQRWIREPVWKYEVNAFVADLVEPAEEALGVRRVIEINALQRNVEEGGELELDERLPVWESKLLVKVLFREELEHPENELLMMID
jgi:hypothetical protein